MNTLTITSQLEQNGSGVGAHSEHPPHSQRDCTECNQPIPAKRLKALPSATQCVECLNKAGDVVKIKCFDEYVGEEKVSTLYTAPNQYLKVAISRDALPVRGGGFNGDETSPCPIKRRQQHKVYERMVNG